MLTTRTPTVVITLKGGHVQSVSTSRPDLLAGFKAVIIDHEISGVPLEDIVRHIGPDGDLNPAVVSVQEVEELTFPWRGREEGYFWAATVQGLLDYLAKALELYEGPLVVSRESGGFRVRGMN